MDENGNTNTQGIEPNTEPQGESASLIFVGVDSFQHTFNRFSTGLHEMMQEGCTE